MLARCPECRVTHALASGDKVRLHKVRCSNCGAEFALFPALEIGGAGERVLGEGVVSADRPPPPQIESIPKVAWKLDIEAPPGLLNLHTARGRRAWPGLALALGLLALFGLQVLIIPPIAPGQQAELDQARTVLCGVIQCPDWHPPRVPGQVRVSTPDFLITTDGNMHLRFELESPIRQAWPVLDIQLTDRLGTSQGRLRLNPADYTDPQRPMAAHQSHTVRAILLPLNDRVAGIEIRPR